MNFLYPEFLFGLFALFVPIIIHLFHFRKFKKVYFTQVKFLKQIKQESESTSKLKNYLILCSRILLLTCLVLVFAQPFIPSQNNRVNIGTKSISIFVDNSFSMDAENKNGRLFEQAKNKARDIVKSYKENDKFQVLTHDFEGKHQHLLSKEDALEAIDEIKQSSSFRLISEIYARQADLLHSAASKNCKNFIVSDFQENMADFKSIKTDTAFQTYFIPVQGDLRNNVFIDSCWFSSPVQQFGMNQKLQVRIANYSDNEIENASLKLYSNNKLIAPATFSLEPNSVATVEVSFLPKTTGIQNCYLEIEDYPVTFDNRLYFNFEVKEKIKTLIVNGKKSKSAAYFSNLLRSDSLFDFTEFEEDNIAYSEFNKATFIIINDMVSFSSGLTDELIKFTQGGGSIFITPNVNVDLTSYNNLLSNLKANTLTGLDTVNTKVDFVNYNQGLYEGVFERQQQNIDLPKVFSSYSISKAIHNSEDLVLRLLNDNKFLTQTNLSNGGKLFLCASSFDLTASNFVKHAFFVPTIIRMAIMSSKTRPLYFKTGINNTISIRLENNTQEPVLHIVDSDNSFDVIPEVRKEFSEIKMFTQSQIKKDGNYYVKNESQITEALSFNYDRKESVLKMLSPDSITKQLEKLQMKSITLLPNTETAIQESIIHETEGTKLWKLFLLLTLFFLLVEILLIRFLK